MDSGLSRSILHLLIFLLFIIYFKGQYWSLALARKALHHLSHTLSPFFCFSYFLDGFSHFYLRLTSYLNSPTYAFNYKCVSHAQLV
jgi:hypothetical protein